MKHAYALAATIGLATIGLRTNAWPAGLEQTEQTRPASRETASDATATCAEVSNWMNRILPSHVAVEAQAGSFPREMARGTLKSDDLDCAAVPALPRGIGFELSRIFFEPRLQSWEFVLRCARPGDCVPFLIRWHPPASDDSTSSAAAKALPSSNLVARDRLPRSRHFLLRPGQTVNLVWEQDGIRIVLPVLCLEGGEIGDAIRVRIKNGERVLRAQIVSRVLLRAVL